MAHWSEPHIPTKAACLPVEQDLAPVPLWIGRCALRAALHEAAATGKPGLVCADTCGAHADMDIRTLFLSAVTLQPYFQQVTELGLHMAQSSATKAFEALRPLGLGEEQAMFAATQGVNTHKGLIFSLGLCSAGEQYFCATGNGGIRAEAEGGFPHALQAWALFCRTLPESDFNTACLVTLLHLMAHVPDSTVWHRAGQEGQSLLHRDAALVLTLVQDQGLEATSSQKALATLRSTCLAHRLSPGGCADLLAVTLFLYFMSTDAPAKGHQGERI